MENETSRSRIVAIVCICVAILVVVALVAWIALATESNRPVDTVNATQASLGQTGGVSVEMDGLGDDLLVGPIISLTDKDGNTVVDHLEMRGSQSLPGVRAGKYDLTVDAPAIGRDGMVYECLDPVKEVIVGDDGSVVIDLGFRQVPIEEMTPEQLQKVKDELEAAGVSVEVVNVVSNTYDPTQQQQQHPTGEPIYQQQGQPYTETWTYVETPQQQQPQQQPQQTEQQTNTQEMYRPDGMYSPDGGTHWYGHSPYDGHEHVWTIDFEYIKTGTTPAYLYCTSFICKDCSAGIASNVTYPYQNPHPEDEATMLAKLQPHWSETGHSGYRCDYAKSFTPDIPFKVVEHEVCSWCGLRK